MIHRDEPSRVLVLGASGGVGRELLSQGLALGLTISAQTRDATKLREFAEHVRVIEAHPLDHVAIDKATEGQDAVIFALGVDGLGHTTLLSQATELLIAAMHRARVRRLIAITGIGVGETRGHGGFLYDWVIFPLFTRKRYADKERQETMIEASGLDWTIVRPAPFSDKQPHSPLEVHTEVGPETSLRRITRTEVAKFVLDQLRSNEYVRRKPFIGHP